MRRQSIGNKVMSRRFAQALFIVQNMVTDCMSRQRLPGDDFQVVRIDGLKGEGNSGMKSLFF